HPPEAQGRRLPAPLKRQGPHAAADGVDAGPRHPQRQDRPPRRRPPGRASMTQLPAIRLLENPAALYHAGAEEFVRRAGAAIRDSGRFTVALSGGSTPRGVHGLLASEPFRSRVAWERVEFFWGDERHVPPDHPDSNY